MALSQDDARQRFASARIAHLATADTTATPHLVPITFAVHDDAIVFAIDHKPKTSTNLKRLRNIDENPQVAVLVDKYDEDWTHLWWARADGTAQVLHEAEECRQPLEWLCAKYPQYQQQVPVGPIVQIKVQRWTSWSFTP